MNRNGRKVVCRQPPARFMAGKNTLRLLSLPIFFDRFNLSPRNQIGTQLRNRILHRPLWSVNTACHHSVCPNSHRALVKYLTSSIYLHAKRLAEKNDYFNQNFFCVETLPMFCHPINGFSHFKECRFNILPNCCHARMLQSSIYRL